VRGAAAKAGHRVLAAWGLGLLLAGCVGAPPPAPPAPPISPELALELARRWTADWEAFPGLRAAVDLTVRNRRGTERIAGVLLVAPTGLRLEVATPFGLPAFVGTASPDGITVYRVLERRAETASATPEATARWLGVPLPPMALLRLLVGHVPLPADPGTIAVAAAPTPHLTWAADGIRYRVWPTPEGRPGRVALDTGAAAPLMAEFQWSVGGTLVSVQVDAPAGGAALALRYVSAEYAATPPEAFRLTLPPDVPVRRLD
jgi:hypothetical protein